MDNIKAPEAQAAEKKVLDTEVKETRVLSDGKLENTLNELREAGHVSPFDRRVALAAKGGPDGTDAKNDLVNAPAIPVEKDLATEKKAVEAVKREAGVAKAVDTDTAKEKVAKAKLSSK
jgi:hypothetical protein